VKYELPLDFEEAVEKTGCCCVGGNQTGKTNTMMNIADLLLKKGIIIQVFDISQVWQKKSSVPNYISVEPGKKYSFSLDQSLIWDLSGLYTDDIHGFAENTIGTIFMEQSKKPESERSYIFFIFEEAQIYLYQGCSRKKSYREAFRMVTVGANYNIRFGAITPRPALLDKAVLETSRQLYLFGISGKNNLNALKPYLDERVEELVGLKTGECLYKYRDIIQPCKIPLFKSRLQPIKINPIIVGRWWQ